MAINVTDYFNKFQQEGLDGAQAEPGREHRNDDQVPRSGQRVRR